MNELFINVTVLFHNLTTKELKKINKILDERKQFITITHSSEDSPIIEITCTASALFSLITDLNINGYMTEMMSIDKAKPMELIIKRMDLIKRN